MTSLFRNRQPFLQTNAWQNQALNALHYNTSQQGSVVPLIYGTTRQQVNVVDLLNYMGPQGAKGKAGAIPLTGNNTQQVGKGGGASKGKGSKKNANFSVDVMFAICQGSTASAPLNVYSSSGVAAWGSLGLNAYGGGDGQAVDPVFNSLGHTVNYSGTAMISGTPMDLGQSPVLPNLSVEQPGILVGIDVGSYGSDANPAQIIIDFLTNARYGAEFPAANLGVFTTGNNYGSYCQAAQLLISISLDGHQKAIEYLDQICKLTNSALVWSGKLLKIIPWGDLSLNSNGTTWDPDLTPVYSFTDDDFLPWHPHQDGSGPSPGEEDPILLTRKNPADAYNWFSIEYTDRSNFYNSTTLTVSDQGAIDQYGLRIGDTIQGRAFCNQTSAQISAQLALQRSQYIRNTPYRFQVGWRYGLLEPMDIVLLTGRAGDIYLFEQPVRVTSVEEDENGNLIVEGEEIQTGTSVPPPVPGAFLYFGPFETTFQYQYSPSYLSSTITTTPSPDVPLGVGIKLVVLLIANRGDPTPVTVASISDSLGLTWNQRSSFSGTLLGGGPDVSMEIWWADASAVSAPTSIRAIATMSGVAFAPFMVAATVYGPVNLASPWDTNSSLPAKLNSNLAAPSISGITTNSTNVLLISWLITVPSGWTGVEFSAPPGISFFKQWSNLTAGIYPAGGAHLGFLEARQSQNLGVSGYTAAPFFVFPYTGSNDVNPNNHGFLMIVDAIAGT